MIVQSKKSKMTPSNIDDILQAYELPTFMTKMCREEQIFTTSLQRHVITVQTLKETYHRLDYLYDTIKTARYNLCMYYKDISADLIIEDADETWIKSQFLANALMWYSISFDIVLQYCWIFYRLYLKTNKYKNQKIRLTTDEIASILQLCTYEKVSKYLPPTDKELWERLEKLHTTNRPIREWTNKLKHRGNLRKNGINDDWYIKVTNGAEQEHLIYNSEETQTELPISDAVACIKNYHQTLIEFLRFMIQKFEKIVNSDTRNS